MGKSQRSSVRTGEQEIWRKVELAVMSSQRHQVIREEPYRGHRMEIQKTLFSASFLPAHHTCASSPPRMLTAFFCLFLHQPLFSQRPRCSSSPSAPGQNIVSEVSPGRKCTVCRGEVLLLFSCERHRWSEAAISAPTFLVCGFHTPCKANRQGRRADCRKLFLSQLPGM